MKMDIYRVIELFTIGVLMYSLSINAMEKNTIVDLSLQKNQEIQVTEKDSFVRSKTMVLSTPKITKDLPDSIIAWTGSQLVLFIEVQPSSGKTRYQWYKNNQTITNASQDTYAIKSLVASDAGEYHCQARDGNTNLTSKKCKVKLSQKVFIQNYTKDTALEAGQTLRLSVTATGEGILKYEWLKNQVKIPNANQSVYEKSLVTELDAGVYKCIVSNEGSKDSTPPINVAIEGCVVIIKQPQNQTVYTGQQVRFVLEALSPDPMFFQWYKGGQSLSGKTLPVLTIESATEADSGKYSCVVSCDDEKINSQEAKLTVLRSVKIIQHPKSQIRKVGDSVTFVVIAEGSAPITYQWRKNGELVPQVSGNMFTITSVSLGHVGKYQCVVANGGGAILSNEASLSIGGPAVITKELINTLAWTGKRCSLFVVATGSEPLTYQWQKSGVAIAGANVPWYAMDVKSKESEGEYRCIVSNSLGSDTSVKALVKVCITAKILRHPQTLTVAEGESANFSVTATGDYPMTYKWLRNGAIVSGVIDSVFKIPQATSSDVGAYRCIVTNDGGSDTSTIGMLTVNNYEFLVQHPKKELVLFMNQKTYIKWKYKGSQMKTVKIEFSADGGTLWQIIAERVKVVPDSCEWIVPQVLSNFCKLKITNADDASGTPSALSDQFSIKYITSIVPKNDDHPLEEIASFQIAPNPIVSQNHTFVDFRTALIRPCVEGMLSIYGPLGNCILHTRIPLSNKQVKVPFSLYTWDTGMFTHSLKQTSAYCVVLTLKDRNGVFYTTKRVLGILHQ